jgi:hypothetical protein
MAASFIPQRYCGTVSAFITLTPHPNLALASQADLGLENVQRLRRRNGNIKAQIAVAPPRPLTSRKVVEHSGFEPLTFSMPLRRSTN